MSNVWARRLIAGTVNPATSPRARASYSAWMLADRAPSAWLASQTSHWAAAVVASSVAECGRPGEVADARAAEGGFVVDDQPVAVEVGGAGRAWRAERSGTVWRRGASAAISVLLVRPDGSTAPMVDATRQTAGLTTIRKDDGDSRIAGDIPPRWILLTVADQLGRRRSAWRRAAAASRSARSAARTALRWMVSE